MWVAGPLPSIGACNGDVALRLSAVRPEVKGLIPPVADVPVMAREPSVGDPPELQTLLDALDDADASAIIRAIEESATANEVSERCDIPLSTTYRKLDVLTEAGLLVEGTEIRSDGHHTTTYTVAFEEVRIAPTGSWEFVVEIARTEATRPDERLADIWTSVREET
jgi:DNA-binding transcriptional ArsR family regulator